MVVPQAMAQTCPQCGADIRLSGARCKACGFWLPATPARRTGPPGARPSRDRGDERRRVVAVLAGGGFVVLGLVAAGAAVWLRQPKPVVGVPPLAAARLAPVPSAEPRLESSTLLSAARRQATAWRRDAVLVSLSVGPLDAQGVIPGGKLELAYAEPSGERVTGGAETRAERLMLSSRGEQLIQLETRAGKGQLAPEPNCVFEQAWAAAQQAGVSTERGPSLRYGWSDEHGRSIWEVLSAEGQVQRRLDGVSCRILSR